MFFKSSITRVEQFNAAHRLYIDSKSQEENEKIYGKCSLPNFHGHNYELQLSIIGEINPETGFVFDISKLKELIREEIIEPFDHKNLNLDVPDFKNTIPTVENIARVIYDKMRARIENQYDIQVKLYETPRIFAEYPM